MKPLSVSRNSLLLWWPQIKDLGVPVPRTAIIEYDQRVLYAVLDGKPLPPEFLAMLHAEAGALGGYPVFLRTDLCSGKHGWENTCYVASQEKLTRSLFGVIEENELAGMLGVPWSVLVLREFLQLDYGPWPAPLVAFYGNMPINKERRYFIRDGHTECKHPYWPREAIEDHTKTANWGEKLSELNRDSEQDVATLDDYVQRVAKAMAGYWSVDFAKSKDGQWYLIDMAHGADSYHWPECERGKSA